MTDTEKKPHSGPEITCKDLRIEGYASVVNEHTRAAVVALAEACTANAEAIQRIAEMLESKPGIAGPGIYITNNDRA